MNLYIGRMLNATLEGGFMEIAWNSFSSRQLFRFSKFIQKNCRHIILFEKSHWFWRFNQINALKSGQNSDTPLNFTGKIHTSKCIILILHRVFRRIQEASITKKKTIAHRTCVGCKQTQEDNLKFSQRVFVIKPDASNPLNRSNNKT